MRASPTPSRRAREVSRLGPRVAATAGAALALLMALSFVASALSITVTSPPDGSWTAQSLVTVNGTAQSPSMDTVFLNSDAELAGGYETNTTVSGGEVIQTFPDTETYRYEQPFTGMAGQDSVDEHWTWNFSATWWEVSALGTLSANPPALAHSGSVTESITWMAALPGNATAGWVAFDYLCEANAFMNVYASTTGHASGETGILSTGASVSTSHWANVSTLANGSDTLVVRFEVGSGSATSSYCTVDDFVAEINFTRALEHTVSVSDDFSDGPSSLWSAPQGGWAANNSSAGSSSPPAFGHLGVPPTSARLNLAFPSGLTKATVSFDYRCEPNASVSAYISSTGSGETNILTSLRGAPPTGFFFDASPQIGGSLGLYLRLVGDSTSPSGDLCAIDNLDIQVTYRGHQAVTYTGSYLSPIADLGIDADLSGYGWWGGPDTNTSVDVFARSSLNNLTFSSWSPVPPSGAPAGTPTGRFVQFRADFTSLGGFETAAVDAFVANFSAIVSVEWTKDQVTWYLASGTTNWTATVPLGSGTNIITVRVRDTTGALVTSQVQVSRDDIPPGPPGKPQAPAVTNGTDVTWQWEPATDVGVGVSHYLVDVGLSPGGFELATGLVVNGTNFTYGPVPDGGTVYIAVRAVDAGGTPALDRDRVISNGTVVDRTAPAQTTVQGPGPYSNAGSLTWTWIRPSDPGTGVASYQVKVGTAAGSGDVFSGSVSGTSYTLLSPTSGTTYFATVTAVDGAGNAGPSSSSAGTTSDLDPPTGPSSVQSGAALTNASTITWTWASAVDASSGVDHYHVEVGTTVGGNDLADINTTDTAYTVGFVESGTFVYLGVTPVDVAGNVGTRVDATVVHTDSTPPGGLNLTHVDPYVANATVRVEWSAVVDGPTPGSSGVAHYVVRVRTSAGQTETTVDDTQTTVTVEDGVTYTVEVFAVDNAGNRGPSSSVTFTGDQQGPAAPGVVTARVTNPLGPSFTASWNASVDAGSGLAEYRVSVGTSPGGTDVASAVRVTRLNFTWTGKEGTDYWVTVWAVDKLGTAGPSVATTDPVRYTATAEGGGFLPGLESVATVVALAGVAALLMGQRTPAPLRGRMGRKER